MTKKMIHTVPGAKRKEFLIPATTAKGLALLGTKSGKIYKKGIVTYTGREMEPSLLADKASSLAIKQEWDLYSKYIEQIPNFKISKEVMLDETSKELKLIYYEANS